MSIIKSGAKFRFGDSKLITCEVTSTSREYVYYIMKHKGHQPAASREDVQCFKESWRIIKD